MTGHITVASERALLTKHLDWIARQEWVDECYRELQALLGQLRATNGTAAAKPIARCHLPIATPAEDLLRGIFAPGTTAGVCGGGIRIDDANGCAYCERCRETWTADAVRDLAQVVAEQALPRTDDGRVMMTVAQIVARFGGNANSVRVRLSRAGVAGVNGYYDTAVFDTATAC